MFIRLRLFIVNQIHVQVHIWDEPEYKLNNMCIQRQWQGSCAIKTICTLLQNDKVKIMRLFQQLGVIVNIVNIFESVCMYVMW